MTTGLTTARRAELKADLERRREELSHQLGDHLRGQSRADHAAEEAALDADDASQRAPDREVAVVLNEHERRELEAVNAALQRLQGEHFGICIDCGINIPFERLKAEPFALRCVACATEVERRAR